MEYHRVILNYDFNPSILKKLNFTVYFRNNRYNHVHKKNYFCISKMTQVYSLDKSLLQGLTNLKFLKKLFVYCVIVLIDFDSLLN